MIFGTDRSELRQMYADAWRKYSAEEILNPLESQIAAVIEEHPEYHVILSKADTDAAFSPEGGETNPFLHMGLHLALREQVSTDRPSGIAGIQQKLAHKLGDRHAAEHLMFEALAETLWEAQRSNTAPDEQKYVERLRTLA
jgi:hypothetical protein